MSIFILAGGNDRTSKDYGHHLAQEVAKHVSSPKILSCFFSWPQNTWEEKAKEWEVWFSDHLQLFSYDYAKMDTFLEQIDNADVIYFHGGDTGLLLETLPDTNELKQHLTGKVVIGSSAGANMLSTHFWSSRRGVLGRGRGILHTNVMVHYGALNVGNHKRTKAAWSREEAEFQKQIESRAITRLPEGEFVVVEKKV